MTNEYIIRDEAMTLPVLPREQRIQLNNVDEAFEEGWRQALENLAFLPAADVVEVRHGRWELHDNGDGTCSRCGVRQKHIWDMDGWQNFCGHCGADMRNGGQDEE